MTEEVRPTADVGATVRRLIVSVGDLDDSLHLYVDVLGLRLAWRDGVVAQLVTVDGTDVLLHQRPPQPSSAAVAVGFQVRALDSVIDAWVRMGGGVVDEPAPQPWGELMATLQDVDGHIVCVSQRPNEQPSSPL